MKLVSWIGGNDLKGYKESPVKGPLYATIAQIRPSQVSLLYNYDQKEVEPYLDWLGGQFDLEINARHVELSSPIDYHDIYLSADSFLKNTMPDAILLSPGTPTMQAVWVLLGKTKYPVRFFQSSEEAGVEEVQVPFDIVADFIPRNRSVGRLDAMAVGDVPIDSAFDDIITSSASVNELKAKATVLAGTELPCLIYGETGTGKELFSTAIHNASARRDGPFVAVNCGAIPAELIESQFFGHKKGAFTGAVGEHKGFFQQANGGTIFLDEFGELTSDVQVRLLRVLQDGQVTPVGAAGPEAVNVRVIAATNRDLLQEVAAGRFREDLFYRVAVGVLRLPPLRDRKGDVKLLAEAFLRDLDGQIANNKKFSAKAIKVMLSHQWPGNVRELQATIVRAALWATEDVLSDQDIERAMFALPDRQSCVLGRDIAQGIDINEIIGEVVRHYIPRALELVAGNKTRAAKLLGLNNYQTLDKWVDKYKVK